MLCPTVSKVATAPTKGRSSTGLDVESPNAFFSLNKRFKVCLTRLIGSAVLLPRTSLCGQHGEQQQIEEPLLAGPELDSDGPIWTQCFCHRT